MTKGTSQFRLGIVTVNQGLALLSRGIGNVLLSTPSIFRHSRAATVKCKDRHKRLKGFRADLLPPRIRRHWRYEEG